MTVQACNMTARVPGVKTLWSRVFDEKFPANGPQWSVPLYFQSNSGMDDDE